MTTYTLTTQATFSPATQVSQYGQTDFGTEELFGAGGTRTTSGTIAATTSKKTATNGDSFETHTYYSSQIVADENSENSEEEEFDNITRVSVQITEWFTYFSNGGQAWSLSGNSTFSSFFDGTIGSTENVYNTTESSFDSAATQTAIVNVTTEAVGYSGTVRSSATTTRSTSGWSASSNSSTVSFFTVSKTFESPTSSVETGTFQNIIVQTATITEFANAAVAQATVLHPEANEVVWIATTTLGQICAISDIAQSHTSAVTVLPSFCTYQRDIVENVTQVAALGSSSVEDTAETTSSATTLETVVLVSDSIPFATETQQITVIETLGTNWSASFYTLSPGSATAPHWTQTTATTLANQNGSVTFHKTALLDGATSWTAPYGFNSSTQTDSVGPIILDGATIGESAQTASTSVNETASNTSSVGFFTSSGGSALRTEKAFFNAVANFSTTTGFNFNNDDSVRVTLAKLGQTAWAVMPTTYVTASGTNTSQIAIGADVTIKDSGGETSYALGVSGNALRTHQSRQALKGAHSPEGHTFIANAGLYLQCDTTTSRAALANQYSETVTAAGGTFYSALPYVVGMGSLRYLTTSYNVFP
jgi:hypothetical protein